MWLACVRWRLLPVVQYLFICAERQGVGGCRSVSKFNYVCLYLWPPSCRLAFRPSSTEGQLLTTWRYSGKLDVCFYSKSTTLTNSKTLNCLVVSAKSDNGQIKANSCQPVRKRRFDNSSTSADLSRRHFCVILATGCCCECSQQQNTNHIISQVDRT